MREALRDIQERIPFSSFASTLLAAGDEVPMHLGRNCIGQARALANELESKGYDPSFVHLARDKGTHFAVLVEEDGDLFYLDPSAMHEEPVNLTKIFRDRVSAIVESRPKIKGVSSKLTVSAKSELDFHVSKTVQNGNQTYVPIAYDFDLNTRSKVLPRDDDSYVAALERENLILRVLDENGGFTVIKQPIFMGIRRLRKATESGVEELIFAKQDPAFLNAIRGVSDRLLLTPESLVAHIDRATNSYNYLRMYEAM